jgi:hypothetical protein
MRWAGHVAHMGDRKDANRFLVGRSEAKRLLGRFIHIYNDNIKMDLQEDLAHNSTSGGVL